MERRCYCHPSLAPLSYCKRQSRGLVRASAGEYVVIFLTIIYFCVQDRKSWEMARTADRVVWNKGGIIVSRCPTQGQNLPHKSFWGQKIVFGNVNALLSRSTVGKQSKDLCLPPNHKQPNHQKTCFEMESQIPATTRVKSKIIPYLKGSGICSCTDRLGYIVLRSRKGLDCRGSKVGRNPFQCSLAHTDT